MIIRSLQMGRIAPHQYDGEEVPTGIFKSPVGGPRWLSRLGFEGDQQADLKHHSGPDKAVLVYAWEHYAYWEKVLGEHPGPAFLGENLTVEGLAEETACIGDVYKMGEALVQVSQPRVPCYKVNIRSGRPDMLKLVVDSLRTGFYLRVLEEGNVTSGDAITLVRRPDGAPTVAWANRIRHRERRNQKALRRLLAAEGLAEAWHRDLERFLEPD